jgi:hypothetical protein
MKNVDSPKNVVLPFADSMAQSHRFKIGQTRYVE